MSEAREDAMLHLLFQQFQLAAFDYQERRGDYLRWQIADAHREAFEAAMAHVRVLH